MIMTSFLVLTPETSEWTHFFVPPGATITEVEYTDPLPEGTEDQTSFKYSVDAEGDPIFIDDVGLMDMWLARGHVGEDPLLLDQVQTFTDLGGHSFQFFRVGPTLVTGGADSGGRFVYAIPMEPNGYLIRNTEKSEIN